jgi:hypothetical protein
MLQGSQATQGSSGTSSRTKSFTPCLARLPRPSVLQAFGAEDWATTDKVKNFLLARPIGSGGGRELPASRPWSTPTSPPGGVLRLMPSTSTRDLVRDYHGPTRGGPTGYYAIGDYAWSVSDCTLCSASPATQASMRDCGPWGGAGEELLGATPFGAAGRRPNRGCGPRAAAGAARHNVTKPHRPRTYRDAGRERASGAASRSMCQAGASTSRCHWSRTRK